MPRAAKGKPLLSVAQIFTKCQEGVSGHSKYAKILWDVHEAAADQCWKDFCLCLHHLLVMPEVGLCLPIYFTTSLRSLRYAIEVTTS